jgi:hypothetical protein
LDHTVAFFYSLGFPADVITRDVAQRTPFQSCLSILRFTELNNGMKSE